MERQSGKRPLLRFGMIADVQYADTDDKQAWYNPAKRRFYRNSLNQVRKAFDFWNRETIKASFILQLGDMTDAYNENNDQRVAIEKTLECFGKNPKLPTYHTIGNHELYNFKRSEVLELMRNLYKPSVDANEGLYYTIKPRKGIKLICLDTLDISVLGYVPSHPKYQTAAKILAKYHQTDEFDTWHYATNLTGLDRRFISCNGMIGPKQMKWLDQELVAADKQNELVIVFGHVALHPDSCTMDCLMWNFDQVIACFQRHTSVVAYFSGHAHNNGYVFEENIHYVVLHGIIEASPSTEAFSTVTIYEDYIDIDGQGVEEKIGFSLRKTFNFTGDQSTCHSNIDISGHRINSPRSI